MVNETQELKELKGLLDSFFRVDYLFEKVDFAVKGFGERYGLSGVQQLVTRWKDYPQVREDFLVANGAFYSKKGKFEKAVEELKTSLDN